MCKKAEKPGVKVRRAYQIRRLTIRPTNYMIAVDFRKKSCLLGVNLDHALLRSGISTVAFTLIGPRMWEGWSMADFTIVKGMVDGQSISQWTEDWWTWALQAPYATNPLLDATGAFAGVDNNNSVFFVAGTASLGGPATVVRTFDVPAGKPLLIPILNSFDTLDPKNVENKDMQVFKKDVTGLSAEIDGVPIANLQSYLVRTDFFSMGPTQSGSLIEHIGASVGQELTPTKSSGYWLMVEGLAPGQHSLEFGGTLSSGFSTLTTDYITVDPLASLNSSSALFSIQAPAPGLVPELSTWVLMILGFASLCLAGWLGSRRKAVTA
jgi:hypothetical protein